LNKCEQCNNHLPSGSKICPSCKTVQPTNAQTTVTHNIGSVDGGGTVIGVYNKTTIHESADALPAPGESPYQGLSRFDVEDADRFFGREELTACLVDELRNSPMLAIVGASGSGKSSIARAGVIAALKNRTPLKNGVQAPVGSDGWPIYIIRPGAYPLERIAEEVTDSAYELKHLAKAMRNRTDALHLHLENTKTSPADQILVFVDQFEEVFTLCQDKSEQCAFIYNLLRAIRLPNETGTSLNPEEASAFPHSQPSTRLLLTLSAESYNECAKFDALRSAVAQYQEFIGSMSPTELRRAIEAPAWADRWAIEPGLVELILRDVGEEEGRLPLLSHALLETWNRRRGRVLTLAGYQAAGSVENAIAGTADTFYEDLKNENKRLVKDIFLRLITVHPNRSATRRRVMQEDLVADGASSKHIYEMVRRLAEERLLTVSASKLSKSESSKVSVEFAHESLIKAWPRLRNWVSENEDWLAIRNRLSDAVQRWQELEQDSGALYRGRLLDKLTDNLKGHGFPISTSEKEFYDASVANAIAEKKRLQRARRTKLRLYALVVAIVVFSSLLILTFNPIWQERDIGSALAAEGEGTVRRIALNSTNENKIYVLDAGSGVLRSKNGGHDWERIAQSFDYNINDVAATGQILYLATDSGLLSSHDGAQTFDENTLVLSANPVTALAIDPVNLNHIFAASGAEIMLFDKSHNLEIVRKLESPLGESIIALTHTGSNLIALNEHGHIVLHTTAGWQSFDPEEPFASQAIDITAYGTQGRLLIALEDGIIVDAEQSTNQWDPLRELKIQLTNGVMAIDADSRGYYIAGATTDSTTDTTLVCRRKWDWTEQNWWRTRFGLRVPCLQ